MENKRLFIKEAMAEDLPWLVEAEWTCFPDPWSETSLRCSLLEHDFAHILLALSDAEPLGYLLDWRLMGEVELQRLAILPAFRREGWGEIFLRSWVEQLRIEGQRILRLEVREHNVAARCLYEKIGFAPMGRRRGYYRDSGEDAILMEFHL